MIKVLSSMTINKQNLECQDYKGNSPLLLACKYNHKEVVEFLLKKKVSVSARNN